MNRTPPRWHERLLAIVLEPAERAAVLGDLHEEFQQRAVVSHADACRWYRRQVRRSLLPLFQRRVAPAPVVPTERHHMTSILQDVRLGFRMFARRPLVSAVAVFSLATGIGLSTGVYGLLEAAVLRPLPVADPSALRVVLEPRERGVNRNFSYPGIAAFAAAQQSFEGVAAYSVVQAARNAESGSEMLAGELVSGEYFDVLGPRLGRGRGITPADNQPGASPVIVLSEFEWLRLFGGAADLGGRTVRLNGVSFDVVGVTAGGFRGMQVGRDARFFAPIAQQPALRPFGRGPLMTLPTVNWLTLIGRLKEGVGDEQATAELNAVNYGLTMAPDGVTPRFSLTPGAQGDSSLPTAVGSPLRLLLGAGLLVLLVACANVAGLLLARAGDRGRELAVRTALGAGRWRVARLLLIEAAVVGAAGTILGVTSARLVAPLAVSLFTSFGQSVTLDVTLNLRLLLFAVGAGLVTTFGAGLAPVLRHTGRGRLQGLGDSGRTATTSASAGRLRRGLVVAQFALTLGLVATAALLVRTLVNVRAIPTGLDVDHVALVTLDMAAARMPPQSIHGYLDEVVDRTARLPGVRASAIGRIVPLGFGGARMSILVPGYTPTADEDTEINFNEVTPDYFDALAITLVDGRTFRRGLTPDDPFEVVVNETMARHFWEGQRAVGRQVQLGGADGPLMEVVGVARDVKYRNIREEPRSTFYLPTAQSAPLRTAILHVRTEGDPAAQLEALRRTVGEVNPMVAVATTITLADQLSLNVNSERVVMLIGLTLGSTALLLSAVGLFGAMATLVSGRTRELGVRLALGAVPASIGWLVLADGLRLAVAGGLAGVALAVWFGYTVEAQLYGVEPLDPMSLAAAFALLATVAVLAALLPAHRATRVDPVEALRVE